MRLQLASCPVATLILANHLTLGACIFSLAQHESSGFDLLVLKVFFFFYSLPHIASVVFSICFKEINGFSYLAVGQNQWYHFGVGAPLILVYFSGDWDVHWGYGILTHGHFFILPSPVVN